VAILSTPSPAAGSSAGGLDLVFDLSDGAGVLGAVCCWVPLLEEEVVPGNSSPAPLPG